MRNFVLVLSINFKSNVNFWFFVVFIFSLRCLTVVLVVLCMHVYCYILYLGEHSYIGYIVLLCDPFSHEIKLLSFQFNSIHYNVIKHDCQYKAL